MVNFEAVIFLPVEEVKSLKKVYKGVIEGNIVRLDKETGFPAGTQAVVTLKVMNKKEQDEIKERQLKLLDEGFSLGKKLYSRREDLYAR
ncbi:MAG: hypothetical protein AB1847_05040 [bacterium]